jgi:DMSO/TMAO reductase YedYZ molybdopterin-dependent catalytic subunit
MDGKPVPDAEGPLRLVVDGDLRPARSARMVEKIEVRRLAR